MVTILLIHNINSDSKPPLLSEAKFRSHKGITSKEASTQTSESNNFELSSTSGFLDSRYENQPVGEPNTSTPKLAPFEPVPGKIVHNQSVGEPNTSTPKLALFGPGQGKIVPGKKVTLISLSASESEEDDESVPEAPPRKTLAKSSASDHRESK